jgi:hypothetical protein
MVEPLNPNQSQNQPQNQPQEATRVELVRMAREDKRLLKVVLVHGEKYFTDASLFWAVLAYRQVKYFIKLHPSVYQPCILCEEKEHPIACLTTLKKPLDIVKHCAAHADEFHARLPIEPLCCEPLYHPHGENSWRSRAIEMERREKEHKQHHDQEAA